MSKLFLSIAHFVEEWPVDASVKTNLHVGVVEERRITDHGSMPAALSHTRGRRESFHGHGIASFIMDAYI